MVEEIDTHYCPADLDNYPSHEAMKNQNRSTKSVECPGCGTHLQVVNDIVSNEYFFECHWCWWDSRKLGLTGLSVDDVMKELRRRERENDQEQEMDRLVKHFSAAAAEAAAAAADAQKQRRGLAFMGTLAAAPKPAKKAVVEISKEWEAKQSQLGYMGPRQEAPASPVKPEATAGDVDALSISEVSTLEQRLRQPDTQEVAVASLLPRRQSLLTKRSKRCPATKNLIVKPEMGASKATFQKNHAAFKFIPRVTVCHAPKADLLLVRFTNPLEHLVSFSVEPWRRPGDKDKDKPFLYPVPDVSTTVGAKEDIEALADKPRELRDDDDPALIHSRTTNSVVLKFAAPAPLSTALMQARLKVTVKVEEEDLDSLTVCVAINVPLAACGP